MRIFKYAWLLFVPLLGMSCYHKDKKNGIERVNHTDCLVGMAFEHYVDKGTTPHQLYVDDKADNTIDGYATIDSITGEPQNGERILRNAKSVLREYNFPHAVADTSQRAVELQKEFDAVKAKYNQ